MHKVGLSCRIVKMQHVCCFNTQHIKKLQKRSLHEVIEDYLPFNLNTKRYKQKASKAYLVAEI